MRRPPAGWVFFWSLCAGCSSVEETPGPEAAFLEVERAEVESHLGGASGDAGVILERALDSPWPQVRRRAALACLRIPSLKAELGALLCARLETERNPAVRRALLLAVGDDLGRCAAGLVDRLAADPSAEVRAALAKAAGGLPEGSRVLEALLLDPDPRVRAEASEAWVSPGAAGGGADPSVLCRALLEEGDESVRWRLASALRRLAAEGRRDCALRGLEALLDHPNHLAAAEAWKAVAGSEVPRAEAALAAASDPERHWLVRLRALDALDAWAAGGVLGPLDLERLEALRAVLREEPGAAPFRFRALRRLSSVRDDRPDTGTAAPGDEPATRLDGPCPVWFGASLLGATPPRLEIAFAPGAEAGAREIVAVFDLAGTELPFHLGALAACGSRSVDVRGHASLRDRPLRLELHVPALAPRLRALPAEPRDAPLLPGALVHVSGRPELWVLLEPASGSTAEKTVLGSVLLGERTLERIGEGTRIVRLKFHCAKGLGALALEPRGGGGSANPPQGVQ